MLEAVAGLDGVPVTFAGEGDEEARLRERAAELGIADRVSFVGPTRSEVHVERMRELVAGAQVLCLPSRSESFGIVMIEALAAGTPVVGFGPTFTEIRDRLGLDIGEPTFEGTPDEVREGLEAVFDRGCDHTALRKARSRPTRRARVAGAYAKLVRELS